MGSYPSLLQLTSGKNYLETEFPTTRCPPTSFFVYEIFSRRQKFQMQTIVEGVLPPEFSLQIQTGLMVTERAYCDFISYSGGMPAFVLRVEPDPVVHAAIVEAATAFEKLLTEKLAVYQCQAAKFHPTERKDYEEIIL